MVLNHPLPLCANTFVLLRDSAHCVMSIHNTRSEAMNVKSPVYTAIVHARKLPNIIFHLSDGPPDDRLLSHERTMADKKVSPITLAAVFVPRWSMQVAAGAIQIATGWVARKGQGWGRDEGYVWNADQRKSSGFYLNEGKGGRDRLFRRANPM